MESSRSKITDLDSVMPGAGPGDLHASVMRGKQAIQDAIEEARPDIAADVQALRDDLRRLQDTVSRLVSRAGNEAARTARDAGTSLAARAGIAAGEVANAGLDIACAAGESTHALVDEVETITRRNPLGALAAALAIGMIIGYRHRR